MKPLRLAFVTQRYGRQVGGGAEALCREVATRLAGRGHHVQVLSTRARSYVTWEDELPAGTVDEDGVVVERYAVDAPRDNRRFAELSSRVLGAKPTPYHLQRAWMEQQGPRSSALLARVVEVAAHVDLVVFNTYLYWPTYAGLLAIGGTVPTAVQTTAHDEPPFHLPLFDESIRRADGLLLLTPEERDLVERRFGRRALRSVTGAGVDLDEAGDGERFRRRFGLGDEPYLVYTGRIDPHKGAVELHHWFAAYKDRNPGDLKLVVVGDPVVALDPHPDVVLTGFVSEQERADAVAGSFAAVVPSYYESFSLSLCEAWVHSKPAIVQGRCEVLAGQVRRAAGGFAYRTFADFETAVEELRVQPQLASDLGASGRRYVEANYRWDDVLQRYEAAFHGLATGWSR